MVDIISKLELVTVHYKGEKAVAATLSNGRHTLYKLDGEMTRKDLEEFYGVERVAPQSSHGKDQ